MSCQRLELLFAGKLADIECDARSAAPAATSGRSPARCEPPPFIILSACEPPPRRPAPPPPHTHTDSIEKKMCIYEFIHLPSATCLAHMRDSVTTTTTPAPGKFLQSESTESIILSGRPSATLPDAPHWLIFQNQNRFSKIFILEADHGFKLPQSAAIFALQRQQGDFLASRGPLKQLRSDK